MLKWLFPIAVLVSGILKLFGIGDLQIEANNAFLPALGLGLFGLSKINWGKVGSALGIGGSDAQKMMQEFLQQGIGAPMPTFAGSSQENIMNQLLGQAQTGARQQTSEVFGRVGRSVSGRGMLAPPGQGRGVLGALQVRGAAPIQRGLQQQETGIRTGALGSFEQSLQAEKGRRLQMTQLLMQLENDIPGIMDLLSGLFEGAGAAAPFIFPGGG